MKYILYVVFILLIPTIGYSQTIEDVISKLENPVITPQSEVEDAIVYLASIPEHDRDYIKCFSTYGWRTQKERQDGILVLSWLLHSLTGVSDNPDKGNAGGFEPLAIMDGDVFRYTNHKVPDSQTLWWIDIRDYNWTPQAWEKMSTFDAYFAEPIVRHDRSGALKILSGNAVVRADWFIVHATDQMRQKDIKGKETIYEILLYANNKKPNTLQEWEEIWGLDIKDAINKGNESYSLVTQSDAVSRHNRIVARFRTDYGDLYKTFDVLSQTGKGNYVDAFFLNQRKGGEPDKVDAGEMFANNILQGWVYGLYTRVEENGKQVDKIVDFGDPGVVRHLTDVVGDARVRNAHSCFDCHAAGPIPPENTIKEYLDANKSLYLKYKDDTNRVDRNYLSEQFERSIEPAQIRYAQFVKDCNGLEPVDNTQRYLAIVSNYYKPLTLEQQAHECGIQDINKYIDKISAVKFGARIKLSLPPGNDLYNVAKQGNPIPRDVWESLTIDGIPGAFQQAMIAINGLTEIQESITYGQIKAFKVLGDSVYIKGSSDSWKQHVPAGTILEPLSMEQYSGYFKIKSEIPAYIHNKDIKILDVDPDDITIFKRQ